jgi:hypothetical protein
MTHKRIKQGRNKEGPTFFPLDQKPFPVGQKDIENPPGASYKNK